MRQCCALHTRGGDIAQPVGHQAHAKARRRLADRADAVLLIDQDLPDLLGVAVAAFGLEAGGLGIEIEDLQDVRIVRLGALLAAGRVPRRIGGPERRARDRPAWPRSGTGTAARSRHCSRRTADARCWSALAKPSPRSISLHIGLDADLAPLVGDHFGQLGIRQERRDRDDLQAQPLAIVGAQPEAIGVLLRQPDLVEQRIGLRHVEHRPLLAPVRRRDFAACSRPARASQACRHPARTSRSAGRGRCPATARGGNRRW